jgi:hypothetical protein
MTTAHGSGNDNRGNANRGNDNRANQQHLCIACPKVFRRRDHLKRHMSGHVETKPSKVRGRKPKELEDEVRFCSGRNLSFGQVEKMFEPSNHFLNNLFSSTYSQ